MEQPAWLHTLSVAAASLPLMKHPLDFRVRFITSTGAWVLDLKSARILPSDATVSCSVEGRDQVFSELAGCSTTLQREYVVGSVRLTGDSEDLLRLSMLFDACSAR